MNNEYYGIATTPNDDFLAHYGVKGMHWGVRKAIANGNKRSLERQHRKAVAKLERLKDKANQNKQAKIASEYKKAAILNGIAAPMFVGAGHLIGRNGRLIASTPRYQMYRITDARIPGYVAGASSLANSIGYGVASYRAKKRALPKGHKEAVKKVNQWKREMDKAFKGTKYKGKYTLTGSSVKSKRK